jgi:hypothetical protein
MYTLNRIAALLVVLTGLLYSTSLQAQLITNSDSIKVILNRHLYPIPLPAQRTTDSAVALCLAQCSNGTNNVISNCFQSATTLIGTALIPNQFALVRKDPIPDYFANPYAEFDLVIATLKKDVNNPYPLTYTFRTCDQVCNAASVMVDTGRYIFYNQFFLNNLRSTSAEVKWIVRSIIAHEIGHHILEHTLPSAGDRYPEQRRKQELLADYFSAFVIKQFPGSTLDNALAGINSLDAAQYTPQNDVLEVSADYPTLAHRREAIIEGFTHDPTNPLRIAMFKRLDSIGARNLQKLGRTIILREIDKQLSFNNIREAQEKLSQLEKHQTLSPEEKTAIDNLKSQLNKLSNPIDQSTIDNIQVSETDIENLRSLYDKIKNSRIQADKLKAESLKKTIQKLEEKQGP